MSWRYTAGSGAELEEIARLSEAGKVKPKIARTFRPDEAVKAQDHVAQGHTEGKVVLQVAA